MLIIPFSYNELSILLLIDTFYYILYTLLKVLNLFRFNFNKYNYELGCVLENTYYQSGLIFYQYACVTASVDFGT